MSEDAAASWFDQERNRFCEGRDTAAYMRSDQADPDEDPAGRPHPPVGENTATGTGG